MFRLLLIISLLFMSTVAPVYAETVSGSDDYVMSEFESLDVAKQRAMQKALRNAQESAGVFVQSSTQVVNLVVTKDEINTMTAGILKVLDVQYDLTPLEGGKSILVKATVQAEIADNDIEKWLNRPADERSELVAQNLELQKAIAAQDAQIAELKRQLADKPQDTEKISKQFATEDKAFLSNQKLFEASKFYYNGDLNGAINLCAQAIEFNTSNAVAYSIRGAIYYRLNDFNSAIADYNKAIELNASDYQYFYNRGLAYVQLNNFSLAAQDFSSAIQLNPSDSDSWYNRAICRQRLGDYAGCQEDLSKAKSLGYQS